MCLSDSGDHQQSTHICSSPGSKSQYTEALKDARARVEGAVGERMTADCRASSRPRALAPQSGVGGRVCGPGQPGHQQVLLTFNCLWPLWVRS